MPTNVDHVADAARGGVELVRLAKLYPFPDFVKQASQSNLLPADLTPSVYADPVHRQFRCDTKAGTWLSTLFYQEKRAEFHPKDRLHIEKRLEHYARYWGIKNAVDELRARWQENHKTAESELPDSMYAYVWVGEDGHKTRHLPLRTRMEVKAAAEWLLNYRDRLPFRDRHVIANKILEKKAAYGAGVTPELQEFLDRQAGRGVCDPAAVVEMIRNRALLVPETSVWKQASADGEEKPISVREHFRTMADAFQSLPRRALLPQSLVKLAETIDQLDRQQGWIGKYSEGLPRPEDVIFSATLTKSAAELHTKVALTSGTVYDKQELSKLALDDIKDLFGTEFVDLVRDGLGLNVEKLAEQIVTLPRPDAQLVDALCSEKGIQPSLFKAASARQGLSPEEERAWAAAYASA